MDETAEEARKPLLLNDMSPETLSRNVTEILCNLSKNRYQNSEQAKLIAVTKTVTPAVINLLKPLQILDIGENRAQVALPKLPEIDPEFRLHWIGRLQSNKVKYIINYVCMLHSLDRLSLAQEVERQAGENGRALDALVQVNIAGEAQKGGMPPEEVLPFLKRMRDFPHIRIRGLMSIMPIDASDEELRALFRGMRALFERLREEAVNGVDMRELSMGMSRDYAIAASEGATMVRVGTALYRQ